ncbi:hypothetical protein E2562_027868 [Oryza meyeriana var. granulata]|uniref:Glycosyltransferase 2-like domain-containing protein n=1 Tax=Oryza meyeriana var. granulata TaxID=110450 RepID=A0A6G1CS44_9ORYZ|nr:hypothetical protein E2562_027868 [Oryza meyeriana var. granulata]
MQVREGRGGVAAGERGRVRDRGGRGEGAPAGDGERRAVGARGGLPGGRRLLLRPRRRRRHAGVRVALRGGGLLEAVGPLLPPPRRGAEGPRALLRPRRRLPPRQGRAVLRQGPPRHEEGVRGVQGEDELPRREGAQGAGGRVGHVGRHAVAGEQPARSPCHDSGDQNLSPSPPLLLIAYHHLIRAGLSLKVLLGHSGDRDVDGGELPRLFYVSREKRPGFPHHGKAGAMNALLRVSALLTNGAYVLNLDYDHCVNSSSALREAMCFMMDPAAGNRTCFVQFALRDGGDGDGDDGGDSVFFDIEMKCLDGIQGPVYVGSGCCFSRKALYGFEPAVADDGDEMETAVNWRRMCCFGRGKRTRAMRRSMSAVPLLDSEEDSDEEAAGRRRRRRLRAYRAALERHFGQSPAFIASAFEEQGRRGDGDGSLDAAVAGSLLKEAIHVVSCAYEQRTRWGKEIGWIYGAGDGGGSGVATGFRMHVRGWSSAYCAPVRPAFRSYARASPSDVLAGASRRAVAAMRILLSRRHCPVWGGDGGRLSLLQRLCYVNRVVYPLASLPLTVYCALPAVCLLTGKFTFPGDVSYYDGVLLILLLSSVVASVVLELRWSRVALRAWWRDEKLWVVTGTSASLAAVFQGVLSACTGIDVGFSTETAATSKRSAAGDDGEEEEPPTRTVRWTNLLVPPTSVVVANLTGVVVAVSYGVDHGYRSWGPLGAKLAFAGWVVAHLQGFLRGLLVRRDRAPTIAVLWSVLFVSVVSLLWVHAASFSASPAPPTTQQPIL